VAITGVNLNDDVGTKMVGISYYSHSPCVGEETILLAPTVTPFNHGHGIYVVSSADALRNPK
jgi:hypothetical protein